MGKFQDRQFYVWAAPYLFPSCGWSLWTGELGCEQLRVTSWPWRDSATWRHFTNQEAWSCMSVPPSSLGKLTGGTWSTWNTQREQQKLQIELIFRLFFDNFSAIPSSELSKYRGENFGRASLEFDWISWKFMIMDVFLSVNGSMEHDGGKFWGAII